MSTSAVDGSLITRSAPGRPRPAKQTPPAVVIGAFATLALGIAIGSFIVNANSTSSNSARMHTQVSSLRQQLATTSGELAATNRKLAAIDRKLASTRARLASYGSQLSALRVTSDTTPLQRLVISLEGSVSRLALCLPRLQQELSGLRIKSRSQNGSLTSASLSKRTVISGDCTQALSRP